MIASPTAMQSYDGLQGPVNYPNAPPPVSPYFAPMNAFEHIPHRVFVGGFSSSTTESDLRVFFEKFGHIREAKIIRSPDGASKGYGFVTLDTEEEANAVRSMPVERLEFHGRRLNLGPAIRRIGGLRFGSNGQYWGAPSPTFNYAFGYPQAPSYVMVAPTGPLTPPSSVYSPQTSPVPSPLMNADGNNNCVPNMATNGDVTHHSSPSPPSTTSTATPTPLVEWVPNPHVESFNHDIKGNTAYGQPPQSPYVHYQHAGVLPPQYWPHPPSMYGTHPDVTQQQHHFAVPPQYVPYQTYQQEQFPETFFADNGQRDKSQ
jgi:RNA recognition motif-containing protein